MNICASTKIVGSPNDQHFYLMVDLPRSKAAGRKFLNSVEVCRGSGSGILSPPSTWERGFRPYSVLPRFSISKRLGRTPPDVENYLSYWFVSANAKQFLDAFSPDDFVYQKIDVEVDAGCEPADWWLCDVVHVLDAVDEERSTDLHPTVNDVGQKLHPGILHGSTVFDERIVGDHEVFRLKTSPHTIVCAARFKNAFKSAGLKGQSFLPAFEPSCDWIGTVRQVARHGTGPLAWRGVIAPDGRGAGIHFVLSAEDGWKHPPFVGERVCVFGRRMKWPGGGWSAKLVTRLQSTD